RINHKPDVAFFSRLEKQSLGPTQRSDRHRHRCGGIRQVHLDDLITRQPSGILYLCTDLDTSAALHGRRTQLHVAVCKLCVAQTIAEWIKRLALEVTIGA